MRIHVKLVIAHLRMASGLLLNLLSKAQSGLKPLHAGFEDLVDLGELAWIAGRTTRLDNLRQPAYRYDATPMSIIRAATGTVTTKINGIRHRSSFSAESPTEVRFVTAYVGPSGHNKP